MGKKTSSILYVTFDGVLQHLGYSQVVRPLLGLGAKGHGYVLLTYERAKDMAQEERVFALRNELRKGGVEWEPLVWQEGGSGQAAVRNLTLGTAKAMQLAATRKVQLVHARGYHGAAVAYALRRSLGIPYVFDARGYWIDERLEDGRWFTRPVAHAVARRAERGMYEGAQAIVTLTDLHREDLRTGARGVRFGGPVLTIPTCADFNEFRLGTMEERDQVRREFFGETNVGPVLGIVGSANSNYQLDATVRLGRHLLEANPAARLLVFSAQTEEYEGLLRRGGIAAGKYRVVSVAHGAMPCAIHALDWGALLLKESPAKRASMPTKLAEFLAAGVRPVHFGCNGEVGAWVAKTGSGVTLDSLEEASLQAVARRIAEDKGSAELMQPAREIGEEHFSLKRGVERYDALLCGLLGSSGADLVAGRGRALQDLAAPSR